MRCIFDGSSASFLKFIKYIAIDLREGKLRTRNAGHREDVGTGAADYIQTLRDTKREDVERNDARWKRLGIPR